MPRPRRTLALFAVILACVGQGAGPKPVELLRAPKYLFDNSPIGFQVRVQPNAAYRLLRVAALNELGDTARASDEQLDGLEARTTRLIEWQALDAGHYTLVARVFDEAGADCARTAEYWGSCKAIASVSSNLEVRGFSEAYQPFDDPQ